MAFSPKKVRIETDESGFIKAVTIGGEVIPNITELTFHAAAGTALPTVEITISLPEVEATAEVGAVNLICPLCTYGHKHLCFDNPTEEEAHPTY